jgi:hypothetical protein
VTKWTNKTELGWEFTNLEEGTHGDIVDINKMFSECGHLSEAKHLLLGPGPSQDNVKIIRVCEMEIWGLTMVCKNRIKTLHS